MKLSPPGRLVNLVVHVASLIHPPLLERDSLKMCWPVRSLAQQPLPPGFSANEVDEAKDLAAWIQVLCAAGMPVSEKTWASEFGGRPHARVHGLYWNDTLVATAATRTVNDCPSAAYLLWVGVDPAHQGRGLGRHLVTLAMNDVQQRGYSHLFLLTNDHRHSALALYADLGFRACLASWDRTQPYRWQRLARRLRRSFEFCTDTAHREPVARMAE